MSDQTSSAHGASPSSLAAAVAALHEAADELTRKSSTPHKQREPVEEAVADHLQDDPDDYYGSLQRRGALVDVDEDVDLTGLPPSVTHVRFTDGRVERVGFS